MNKINNHKFYKKAIDLHGISPKGVYWKDEESQYKRFYIITELLQDEIEKCSIVDAGCGFGEYYNYLLINDFIPKKYIGIDCMKEMVELSRSRFKNVDFFQMDVLKNKLIEADYYICSGGMNILEEEEFYKFIERCFAVSTKGFVFNFLKNKSYNKVKIDDVISFCSSLTPKIQTRNNYLNNDFTIFMIK
jgi:SAM-dependent methyltransferase